MWSVSLCIPVRHDGKLVGIMKAVHDLSGWIGARQSFVGELPASVMLVRADGRIIYGGRGEPLTETVHYWRGRIAEPTTGGWRVTEDGHIQAYVPIKLPERVGRLPVTTPSWKLVLEIPRSEALAAVYRLSFWMLGIGLVIIFVIFLVGLMLVNRSVIRRIRRLGRAVQSVAWGNLDHRIELDWAGRRLLGTDEIDDLARDFNAMVEQVQHSHEELRAANMLRTNFIQIAGHELRTPVSYIVAMARMLEHNPDPERLARAVQAMGAKGERLNEIIQAIFKLSPQQTTRSAMVYSDVPIRELLEEVYADCSPFAETRHQRLLIDLKEGGLSVRGDRSKLRDALENLVMNAIKFTPDGGAIHVRVNRELGEYVSIAVQDQGPGIPEADMPHIFEPFFGGQDVLKHSTGSVEYRKQGMGLGLTIVRQFMELHGGAVRVASSPEGATFTITIPLEPPTEKSD